MPTPYIKKLAKEHHTSVEHVERLWDNAKDKAAKEGKGEDYAYITGILKKSMSIKSTKARALLSNVDYSNPDKISYGVYCAALNTLDPSYQVAFSIPGALGHFIGHLKELMHDLVDGLKVGVGDIITALKQKDIFALLKGVGFNLKVILNALNKLLHTGPKMLVHVFQQIEQDGWLEKLKSGAVKVDEFLHAHPILTKVGGVVIGALLLYLMLFGNFTGHPATDLDMTNIIGAIKGSYHVEDLFATPEQIAFMVIGITGVFSSAAGIDALSTGISWLGHIATGVGEYGVAAMNLCLALIYTGLVKAGKAGIAAKLKPYMFGHKDVDKTFHDGPPSKSSTHHAAVVAISMRLAE
jgi:hypothetical protein